MLDSDVERTLNEARVGRLATVDEQGRPHLVPIVFAYENSILYTPIDAKPKSQPPGRLRRVRNIAANANVQVLVDHYEEDWSQLRYLQLRGTAALMTAGEELERAVELLEAKYAQYGDMPLAGRPVIKIKIERAVQWGGS